MPRRRCFVFTERASQWPTSVYIRERYGVGICIQSAVAALTHSLTRAHTDESVSTAPTKCRKKTEPTDGKTNEANDGKERKNCGG